MTRDLIASGMYGETLPSGAFAVLIPRSHVLTHLGIVPLPDGETFGPLFIRCTDVGGFRFAGQAHDSLNPAAYERVGSAWAALPPPCVGVSPLIYDHDGILHRSNGSVGSQGYRYVNAQNQLISGDATYGPFHGLFEYTSLEDGLWIGQGATDGSGVRVWDGSTLRQLETGDCRFIRANRVNDRVALAFSRPEGVVLIQTTMAELRALPSVGLEKQPGPIVNQPEVPVPAAPNKLNDLRALANAHPEINRLSEGPFAPNRGGITQLAAAQWGFPWGRKSRDRSMTNLSDDALCYRLQDYRFEIYDILSGATGEPQWDYAGTFADGENGFFVAIVGRGPAPGPVPPPPVPPPVPVPAPPPAPAHPSYAEMMAMVEACNRAYGREMSAELTAHLVWRYLLEGYAVSDLIEDARERGRE